MTDSFCYPINAWNEEQKRWRKELYFPGRPTPNFWSCYRWLVMFHLSRHVTGCLLLCIWVPSRITGRHTLVYSSYLYRFLGWCRYLPASLPLFSLGCRNCSTCVSFSAVRNSTTVSCCLFCLTGCHLLIALLVCIAVCQLYYLEMKHTWRCGCNGSWLVVNDFESGWCSHNLLLSAFHLILPRQQTFRFANQ